MHFCKSDIHDTLFFSCPTGVYLDHTGATMYSEIQIKSYMEDLNAFVFGNPHSRNSSSLLSANLIEEARREVAQHFNTTLDRHQVIFTSGATAALKLVADSFEWGSHSSFLFLEDNHTSVVGMREIVKNAGGISICVTEDTVATSVALNKKSHRGHFEGISKTKTHFGSQKKIYHCATPVFSNNSNGDVKNNIATDNRGHLFCFPAMSNFCGRKYPLEWIDHVHDGCLSSVHACDGKWYVLLDSASFASTNYLDLSHVSADFVAVSFYKMFGFPTGIGALIVKSDAADSLSGKRYYGGGTVLSTISSMDHHICRSSLAER